MNFTDQTTLEAVGLGKAFPSPGGSLNVLSELDFAPLPGRLTAVVGASGTGKSTLLHILGTLEHPTEGQVLFAGRDLYSLSSNQLARFRNRSIGFVFQFHHLLPAFSALENVMMPGLVARRGRYEVQEQASKLLASVGLADRAEHRPSEMSGGEQQRVAMMRAIINRPALLLADEPSGNLDRESSEELYDLLVSLVRDQQQTTVVATHDERLAERADEVYRLEGGKLHPLRKMADS